MIPNHGTVEYIDISNPKELDIPKYIILASDGLWDVMNIKEVVDIINNSITHSNSNIQQQPNGNKVTPILDIENMINDGYINTNINYLDTLLNSIAMNIVETAVHSDKWINLGTSYIIYY